jgi:cation:H+ antiporter
MTTALSFIFGLALLYVGGEGLVRGAAAIGVRLGMTPLIAGLTIVGFATSAPELAVSIDAALRGAPGLAVGNVVGSNICNLALILGLTALVRPARVRDALNRQDVIVLLASTLLVPLLFLDQTLQRVEGSFLVACMLIYLTVSIRHARRSKHSDAGRSNLPALSQSMPVNVTVAVVSLIVLVLGSKLFVVASMDIALLLGVSTAVVGLSATAIGTSLPELTTSIVCARHGHPEMAAGNLIGSNIFNLLLILGATSLVSPLTSSGIGIVDLGVMIGVTSLALAFMLGKPRVERGNGGILVLIYVAYIGSLFLMPT